MSSVIVTAAEVFNDSDPNRAAVMVNRVGGGLFQLSLVAADGGTSIVLDGIETYDEALAKGEEIAELDSTHEERSKAFHRQRTSDLVYDVRAHLESIGAHEYAQAVKDARIAELEEQLAAQQPAEEG